MKNRRPGKVGEYKRPERDEKLKLKTTQSFKSTRIIIIFVTLASLLYLWLMIATEKDLVTKPFPDAKIVDDSQYVSPSNMDRYWGTYRSQLYFGLKTRSANPLNFGMMWFNQLNTRAQLRHWCDQGDGLTKYGWIAHDGRQFGIHDVYESEENNFHIRNTWIKRVGGEHGGDWSVRTEVKSDDPSPKFISLIFYFEKNQTNWIRNVKQSGFEGETNDLGRFKVNIHVQHAKNVKIDATSGTSHHVNLKDELVNGHFVRINKRIANLNEYIGLKGVFQTVESTFIAYQISGFLPLSFEITYQSESALGEYSNELKSTEFDSLLSKLNLNFEEKFEKIFNLRKKNVSTDEIQVAQAAMSNMIGGIGFFHGQSMVKSSKTLEAQLYWPSNLYTAVPSRSFFPRGFLWDEGFHNLLIQKWDSEISRDIISHWLDMMNIEGWIPREIIFGSEARAKVPQEFWIQNNQFANPPTLFLPLREFLKDDSSNNKEFFVKIFPRLRTWYDWFNKTQSGSLETSYRWRGRPSDSTRELNPKTLTSGLDDYPRATHPDDQELHLDLRCWMTLASRVMSEIARIIDRSDDYHRYYSYYLLLNDNKLLDKLHWSGTQYADWGLHSNDVRLVRPPAKLQQQGPPIQQEMIRQVDTPPKYQFVNTLGYVSIFPLILEILDPQSDKLNTLLDQLRDSKLLWTKYGVRSLAKNSFYYDKHNTEHDPPYWRGAIWININYLTLKSLNYYSTKDGPFRAKAAQVYNELRHALVTNLARNYQQSGYIWEQYNDKTGKGQGSHPFTGWSALYTLILSESF